MCNRLNQVEILSTVFQSALLVLDFAIDKGTISLKAVCKGLIEDSTFSFKQSEDGYPLFCKSIVSQTLFNLILTGLYSDRTCSSFGSNLHEIVLQFYNLMRVQGLLALQFIEQDGVLIGTPNEIRQLLSA